MKLRDTKGRRLRFAPPQPDGSKVVPQERDDLVFELINRFGPLPSLYLYQLTRHLPKARDVIRFQNRLTTLYHGMRTMGQHVTFLTKPKWQQDAVQANYQPIIYDLTEHSKARLLTRGILVTPRESEHPLHRFMGACVMASLYLYVQSRLLEYHDLYKILCHPNCPTNIRQLDNPLAIPREPDKDEKLYDQKGKKIQHALIPDHFFAIQGDTMRPLFCAVEIDRGTETTQDTSRTSLGRKFKHYDRALDTEAFQKHFGIPYAPKILIVTNSKYRRDNLVRYYNSKHPTQYLFSYTEGNDFSYGWRIPSLLYFTWKDGNGKDAVLV
jgi:hypothetical protein